MTEWIKVEDKLPRHTGEYLVVSKQYGMRTILIRDFATDLHLIDKYIFREHKSGWYWYDHEKGFYEWPDITHWMPLPNLPIEIK